MEVIEHTYSLKEAAEFIGCSEWKLRKMVKGKEVPYYQVGNRIRFTNVALSKWIYSQEKRNMRA